MNFGTGWLRRRNVLDVDWGWEMQDLGRATILMGFDKNANNIR